VLGAAIATYTLSLSHTHVHVHTYIHAYVQIDKYTDKHTDNMIYTNTYTCTYAYIHVKKTKGRHSAMGWLLLVGSIKL